MASASLNYQQRQISGFRLQDARASYGVGLETWLDPLLTNVRPASREAVADRDSAAA